MGRLMPYKYATNLKRNVHPFMKIERNRIGSFNPRELFFHILCEHRDCSDCTIHEKPQPLTFAQVG